MRFAVRQPAAYGSTHSRRDVRIEEVEIDRDVDEPRARDSLQRLAQHRFDAPSIHIRDRVDGNPGLFDGGSLSWIEATNPDQGGVLGADGGQQPVVALEACARPSEYR